MIWSGKKAMHAQVFEQLCIPGATHGKKNGARRPRFPTTVLSIGERSGSAKPAFAF